MTKEAFLKKLGANVKRIRKEAGLTQVEVANRMRRQRQDLYHIENGRHNPSAFIMYEVAKAMKVSLSELMDI